MGWRENYAKFISRFPHKYGAELGVLQGKLSVALLKELQGLEKLYCVDHWHNDDSMIKYLETTKNYQNRIETIRMSTREAHVSVPNNSLDFVFVDASHVYRNVITDIVCWMPKLKVGGVMSGHDYIDYKIQHHYDVKGAVDKVFPNASIRGQIWWIINRENKQWETWKNA